MASEVSRATDLAGDPFGPIRIGASSTFRDGELTLCAVMHKNDLDIAAATEALLVASRALVGVAARSFADVDDITPSQVRVLLVLAQPGAVTVGDLAQALDVHPSTATRLCERLEQKRLVHRAFRRVV